MENPAPLTLTIDLPGPILMPAGPRTLTVALTNHGDRPVVVNQRMACGYRDHLARELFAELFDQETGQPAPVYEADYERSFSGGADYQPLKPGETIRKSIDFFKWYLPHRPATYRLVMHYQADEPLASPPEDVCRGIYASEPVLITVRFEDEETQPPDPTPE